MKKKIFVVVLLIAILTLTACGKTESKKDNNKKDNSTKSVEKATGVYKNQKEFVDVNMGVTDEVLCTFKIPTSYVLAAGYFDENGDEKTIEGLNSASRTVKEAKEAGYLDSGKNIGFFTESSINGDKTMITTTMYLPSLITWQELKDNYKDAVEIKNTEVPAIYYHVKAISGKSLAVAIKLNDDISIQIVYEGDLEEEIGSDKLAQELYDLVTIK